MESFVENFEIVLFIIVFVLMIALVAFFALEDHVSKIKKQLVDNKRKDLDSKFVFFLLIGEEEKAKELLIDYIFYEDLIFCKYSYCGGLMKFKRLNPIEKVELCFERYGWYFEKLGIEDPFPEEDKAPEET